METIGTYEQLLYIGFALSFFWIAGLIQGLLTLFPQSSPDEQKRLFARAYLVFAVIALFLYLVSVAFEEPLLWLFTKERKLEYFQLYLLYWAINLPPYLLEYFYLLRERSRPLLLFAGLSFGGHFLAFAIPALVGWSFVCCFYGLILLAVIRHFILIGFLVRYSTWSWDWTKVRKWLVYSSPLMLYALLGGLNQVFDSWLVNLRYGGAPDTFALFRYGAKELPLAMALANALSLALIPEVTKNLESGLQQIRRRSTNLMHLLFPVSTLLMLTSKQIFGAVFDEAFVASAAIFNVYLLILTNRLTFPHTIIIGLGENRVMVYVSTLEFISNILISFWLASHYGLWGIAMGTVLAYWVEKIVDILYLQIRHGIGPGRYTHLGWYGFYTLLLIGSFILVYEPMRI